MLTQGSPTEPDRQEQECDCAAGPTEVPHDLDDPRVRATCGFGPVQNVLVEDAGFAFGYFASQMAKKSRDCAYTAACKQRKDQRGMPRKQRAITATLGSVACCAICAPIHRAS